MLVKGATEKRQCNIQWPHCIRTAKPPREDIHVCDRQKPKQHNKFAINDAHKQAIQKEILVPLPNATLTTEMTKLLKYFDVSHGIEMTSDLQTKNKLRLE